MTRSGRPLAMPAEDRKKEIHAAAEKLFGERGYEKVTMAEIAAEAGMSKKTLYVHFADKEALLKSLVAASYVWPEAAFDPAPADSVAGLALRLKLIADRVLSPRHLKLSKLAIGESMGVASVAATFYQVEIATSRESLVAAVDAIEASRRAVPLDSRTLADMLFGATINPALLAALLTSQAPDLPGIHAAIDRVVAPLFR